MSDVITLVCAGLCRLVAGQSREAAAFLRAAANEVESPGWLQAQRDASNLAAAAKLLSDANSGGDPLPQAYRDGLCGRDCTHAAGSIDAALWHIGRSDGGTPRKPKP